MAERKTRTSKTEVKTEERKTKRTRRVAYASGTSRLSIPSDVREKYKEFPINCFRWVNDEEGEVQRRKDAWWEVCTDPDGNPVKRSVGIGKTTSDLKAYLMVQDPEYFKEDFEKQQEKNMAFQNSLKKSKEAGALDAEGGYAPNLEDGGVGFSKTIS